MAAIFLLVGAFSVVASGTAWGLATPTPTPEYGVNLLVNPGAETGDFTGWATGGDMSGYPRIDEPVFFPSPAAHSGIHRFGAALAWLTGTCCQYQEITVTPGGWYEASFWVTHMQGEAEHVQLAWINGTWPGTENLLLDVGPGKPGSTWIEYAGGTFQAGGSVVTIVVRYIFEPTEAAAIHVDDVSVVSIPPIPHTATCTPTVTPTITLTPTITMTPTVTATATPWPNSFENIVNGDFEMDTGYPRHVPMAWEDAGNYGYYGAAPVTYVGYSEPFRIDNPFEGQAWMMEASWDPEYVWVTHDEIYQDVPVAVGAVYTLTADLAFDGKTDEGYPAHAAPDCIGRLSLDFAGGDAWDAVDERNMQYAGLRTYELSIGPFVAGKSPIRVDIFGQAHDPDEWPMPAPDDIHAVAIDNVEIECHSATSVTLPVSPGFIGILDFGTVEAALEFINCATGGDIRVSRYSNTPLYLANSTGKFWHLTGLPEGAFSAILSFDYSEGEIPDAVPDESALSLWRSNDGGMTWYHVGSVVDMLANRVSTAEPQDSLSLWAIAFYDAPETSARHWELYR